MAEEGENKNETGTREILQMQEEEREMRQKGGRDEAGEAAL
jgi:hypothetical protein